MKNYLVLLMICTGVYACGNAQKNSGTKIVQHDTLVNNITVKTQTDTVLNDGDYVQHYTNGAIKLQGQMKAGKRSGVWKSFYENGKPWSETTFENGVKNGKTTSWYENGNKRYEGYFKNDAESDTWNYWDENGKLVSTKKY